MSDCETGMVRGVDDADGYLCGRTSVAQCCDCGSKLCELHFEECDLCQDTYCPMCLLCHMNQPHARANEVMKKDAPERRIA